MNPWLFGWDGVHGEVGVKSYRSSTTYICEVMWQSEGSSRVIVDLNRASTNASWPLLPYAAGPHLQRSAHMTRLFTSDLNILLSSSCALLDLAFKVMTINIY